MITQLSVFLENRTGQLVQITDILSKNGVNMRAINIAETVDYGILRLITDNTEKAAEALTGEGFVVSKNKVEAVAVPDRAGGLNELLHIISENGIDIEYMYSVFGKADGNAYMIFKFKDIEPFEKAVQNGLLKTADKKALAL